MTGAGLMAIDWGPAVLGPDTSARSVWVVQASGSQHGHGHGRSSADDAVSSGLASFYAVMGIPWHAADQAHVQMHTLNLASLEAACRCTAWMKAALSPTGLEGTMAAATISPYFSSGAPKDTASATSGWESRAPSTWQQVALSVKTVSHGLLGHSLTGSDLPCTCED